MKNTKRLAPLLFSLLIPVLGSGQTGATSIQIAVDDPRPLATALSQLEQQVRFAINYEDPPYTYMGSVVDATSQVMTASQLAEHPAAHIIVPRGGELSLTLPSPPIANGAAVSPLIKSIISASNAHGYAGIYSLMVDSGAYFVVPNQIPNSSGTLSPLSPVLETPISLPVAQRSAGDTVALILNALTKEGAAPVKLGAVPFNLMIHSSVLIGADHETARSVLGRVFSSLISSTAEDGSSVPAIGYQLFYDPGLHYYMLNIHTIDKPSLRLVPNAQPVGNNPYIKR